MTKREITNLTTSQKTTAVAKALGWTDICLQDSWLCGRPPCEELIREVPDYLDCLNAMHEAEKSLPENSTYWTRLAVVTNDKSFQRRGIIHATAEQKVIAFLLCLPA